MSMKELVDIYYKPRKGEDIYELSQRTGHYLEGGCYEYALALGELYPVKYWLAGDDHGFGSHAFVEHKGNYYDVNGESSHKPWGGDYDIKGEMRFKEVSKAEMKTYVWMGQTWKDLVEDFKKIIENQ